MSFGQNIKRLREQRAWTQQELAMAASVSVRTIQRAEEGAMSAETKRAIAAALDETVQSLARVSYPAISAVLYYDRPDSIDWLVDTFGFAVRMKIPGPDGRIVHGEITYEDALILIGAPIEEEGWATPAQLDNRISQSLYVTVDNVDRFYADVVSRGGKPETEPQDAHGQRRFRIKDPESHLWWFVQEL